MQGATLLTQVGSRSLLPRVLLMSPCLHVANKYHEGQSEEWLGKWIEEKGIREEIVLATKYSTPMTQGIVAVKLPHSKFSRSTCIPRSLLLRYAIQRHPTLCQAYQQSCLLVGKVNSGGNHRKNLVQSVEASLKRLRTSYIDVSASLL